VSRRSILNEHPLSAHVSEIERVDNLSNRHFGDF
jgi:hypothetical protein